MYYDAEHLATELQSFAQVLGNEMNATNLIRYLEKMD